MASSSRPPHQAPSSLGPPKNVEHSANSRKGKEKENVLMAEGELRSSIGRSQPLNSSWDWIHLTESSVSKVPPIFNKDGSYFFSLVGPSVKIYSVSTGQVVSILSAPPSSAGISSDILTTAVLNPHNTFQLITGSLGGRLVVWDFLDAALLQTIDISQPIHYICVHKSFKDTVFVAASCSGKKSMDANAVVLRVSLQPFENTTKSAETFLVGKIRFPSGLTLSPSGAWLIVTASHKVYIASTTSSSGFVKYVSPERLTCLAFHPHENFFATGDDKGVVRLWYCLDGHLPVSACNVEKKSPTTALHWHAHAVSSLAFTTNGAYLLSGGEESVLVIWQLHTGKKEFVPRVGAPISTISVLKPEGSEEEFLLGLADATYLFISSGTLKVTRSFSRVKLDPAITLGFPSSPSHNVPPLAVHRTSSTLILPSSHPSSLQIYSPSALGLVSELEVSPSNRVSRRDNKPIEHPHVQHVAVSLSGTWLATIDTRHGNDAFRGEIYLKIWRFDLMKSRWVLNTRVDRPHGLQNVSSLTFSPSSQFPRLVTTGEDGLAKMWGLKTVKQKDLVLEDFWTVYSSLSFRSHMPRSTSWPMDGSLLAVCYSRCVGLYDPATAVLQSSLICSDWRENMSLCFIGRSGRYLAVFGVHHLVLWDLVVHSVQWTYDSMATIERVISHEYEDSFSVFHTHPSDEELATTSISLFYPTSSTPLERYSTPFVLRNCLLYPLAVGISDITYVGVTRNWDVVLIGNNLKPLKEAGGVAMKESLTGPSSGRRTLLQDIFGKAAFADQPQDLVSKDPQRLLWDKSTIGIFDYPAYSMPPLEHIFDSLTNDSLILRSEEEVVPEVSLGDVLMQENVPEPVAIGTPRNRLVEPQEMSAMTYFFKGQTFKGSLVINGAGHKVDVLPAFPSHPSIKPISVSKTAQHGSATPLFQSQLISTPSKVAPTLPATITPPTGRKRKKAMGF